MLEFLDHSFAEGMMTLKKREILLVGATVKEVMELLGIGT
jgi:hypothetical protein